MQRLAAASFLLTLLACGASADGPTPPDQPAKTVEPFQLKVRQTADLANEGLRVRFEGARNDSRCPVDVQCITAGDITVTVVVTGGGSDTRTYELHTEPSPGPVEIKHGSYTVRLVDVLPVPHSGRKIDPQDYVVKLTVARS